MGPMSAVAYDCFADCFPRGRGERLRQRERIHGDASGDFHRQLLVSLFQYDPGEAIAEEILALAAL